MTHPTPTPLAIATLAVIAVILAGAVVGQIEASRRGSGGSATTVVANLMAGLNHVQEIAALHGGSFGSLESESSSVNSLSALSYDFDSPSHGAYEISVRSSDGWVVLAALAPQEDTCYFIADLRHAGTIVAGERSSGVYFGVGAPGYSRSCTASRAIRGRVSRTRFPRP